MDWLCQASAHGFHFGLGRYRVASRYVAGTGDPRCKLGRTELMCWPLCNNHRAARKNDRRFLPFRQIHICNRHFRNFGFMEGRAMNSLRQIAMFVGMGPAGSMRSVPNFVPILSENERTSMRAMIRALESLPIITLEAEASNTSGEVPLLTTVTVHPSPGVIHSTTSTVTQNGQVVGGPISLLNQRSQTSFNAVSPDQYVFNIMRVGVPGTGITTLQKNFVIDAHPHVIQTPTTPPTIGVSSETGGVFIVTGSGFLPNRNIRIRVVDDAFAELDFNQSSDEQGKLNARVSFSCQSGLTLHFSATDGRPSAQDLTGFLFSNTFNIPCP
jgi:hypothetical protein